MARDWGTDHTMTKHFNGLTPAEAERLAMLIEECGEVIQAAGKVLRHGYENSSPFGGPSNRAALQAEVEQVQAVMAAMEDVGDVAPSKNLLGVWTQKLRFAHHQKEKSDAT